MAVAVIWQYSTPQVAAASGIIAASAFVVDATCTLLSRMCADVGGIARIANTCISG